jgi:hypothetical protein
MRKGLLAALAAAACLAAPSLAVAADPPTWISFGFTPLPSGAAPLVSFDISWIDTDLNLYFLADRSNAGIDVFGIKVNPGVFTIPGAGPNVFAGNVPSCPISNACNGPNGVLTLTNPTTTAKELWAGNGPTNNPVCGGNGTICSTVFVYNSVPAIKAVINTGGTFRADELCSFPVTPTAGNGGAHMMVQIANDSDSPPYISWIPVDGTLADTVIQKAQITFATNGLEQCQYDPGAGKVFFNVPEISGPGDDTAPGGTFYVLPFTITASSLPPPIFALIAPIPLTLCAGPQGMAIGPRPGVNILLGCNAPSPAPPAGNGLDNSLVVTNTGIPVISLIGQGGSDEVWFEPSGNRYFLANGSLLPAQQLGITDALTNTVDTNIFVGTTNGTTRRSHSVAGWDGTPPGLGLAGSFAVLPVSAIGGTPAPGFQSILCGAMASQGCFAVFGATPIP